MYLQTVTYSLSLPYITYSDQIITTQRRPFLSITLPIPFDSNSRFGQPQDTTLARWSSDRASGHHNGYPI